ncbi:hypothetical protein EUA04_23065 [Mycolicibacterium obuense]|uniref:Uncharacterized protein n=1 Tax=Mycolicibacterium obuense TaxID=1807 RepID=A0A0M2K210_9MYCO|nr:hypothetical protein [Mycolicibacterium obuense]KKF01191.1 hypothetical protein WN67_14845 [Mycolicibacterium obuense]TDL04645.1 hypothetical protein EUA04_23065 [Mycolicibacterium obuense]
MSRDDDRRLKDFAGAVVLLLLQGFCWRAAMFLSHGAGPVLRYGGVAVLMLTLAVVISQVARKRPAAWFALGGLAVQAAIGAFALLA